MGTISSSGSGPAGSQPALLAHSSSEKGGDDSYFHEYLRELRQKDRISHAEYEKVLFYEGEIGKRATTPAEVQKVIQQLLQDSRNIVTPLDELCKREVIDDEELILLRPEESALIDAATPREITIQRLANFLFEQRLSDILSKRENMPLCNCYEKLAESNTALRRVDLRIQELKGKSSDHQWITLHEKMGLVGEIQRIATLHLPECLDSHTTPFLNEGELPASFLDCENLTGGLLNTLWNFSMQRKAGEEITAEADRAAVLVNKHLPKSYEGAKKGTMFGSGGAAIGATVGFFVGGIGAPIGAAIGGGFGMLGGTGRGVQVQSSEMHQARQLVTALHTEDFSDLLTREVQKEHGLGWRTITMRVEVVAKRGNLRDLHPLATLCCSTAIYTERDIPLYHPSEEDGPILFEFNLVLGKEDKVLVEGPFFSDKVGEEVFSVKEAFLAHTLERLPKGLFGRHPTPRGKRNLGLLQAKEQLDNQQIAAAKMRDEYLKALLGSPAIESPFASKNFLAHSKLLHPATEGFVPLFFPKDLIRAIQEEIQPTDNRLTFTIEEMEACFKLFIGGNTPTGRQQISSGVFGKDALQHFFPVVMNTNDNDEVEFIRLKPDLTKQEDRNFLSIGLLHHFYSSWFNNCGVPMNEELVFYSHAILAPFSAYQLWEKGIQYKNQKKEEKFPVVHFNAVSFTMRNVLNVSRYLKGSALEIPTEFLRFEGEKKTGVKPLAPPAAEQSALEGLDFSLAGPA